MVKYGIDNNEIEEMMDIQMSAWKIGYKNLLPDDFLSKLPIERISTGWNNIVEYHRTKGIFVKYILDNKCIGFCSGIFEDSNDKFEIRMMYVKPDNWERGIGTELFEALHQAVKDQYKTSDMYLWTILNNIRSRSFYEKNGMISNMTIRARDFFGKKIEEIKYEMYEDAQ